MFMVFAFLSKRAGIEMQAFMTIMKIVMFP
ncbi:MAG: hypothetical protein JWR16_1717 [Nevskia sp.]|nr:hypothetical protein [Nevskia sp.]